MTTDEWLARVLADRPPLSPAQIAVLRPVFAPVLHHMRNAAPVTATEAAPAMPAPRDPVRRS